MKNNYFRWATWGLVFGSIYAYKKYYDDTKLHITRPGTEWLMLTIAYIVTYIVLVVVIMAVLRKLRKEE
ncbi:hypothetical protein CJD36_017050 [Flavipsychrobacter stenotrophus]|uniref:Uncharacterized protein n=1 Tax=Flavipsychrobacter stenotrophus TaxID=2077091 RepID=A0A2S7SRV4_9BACT|nr:hypothetical protein [Flavipsychrobacter stenotrophus]PQJ09643.1 hypothetical protein CJD36_017050 [Flavipsychrobacter stenotrophus]